MKKLFLLQSRRPIEREEAFAFVVRAEGESEARAIAAAFCGTEGERVWLDPAQCLCEELLPEGLSGCLVRDLQ